MATETKEIVAKLRQVFSIFKNSKATIRPHLFLTGTSGSGKTYIVENLCKDLKISVVRVNAAAITKEGVSGASLSRVLTPLQNSANVPVVCIVDEFDKLFLNNSATEATVGVQDEFLVALENSATVAADYGKFVSVSTQNVLFVFSGAFAGQEITTQQQLKDLGVRTEFLGRVNLVYHMPKPSIANLHKILKTSPLLNSYIDYGFGDRELAVACISDQITELYDTNTLGVRLVNMLIHQYFIDGAVITAPTSQIVS